MRPRRAPVEGLRPAGRGLFQLGDEQLPAAAARSRTRTFPARRSSFVGPPSATSRRSFRCSRDGARLLTLTGPGGTGKTRLALEAAGELVAGVQGRRLLGAARRRCATGAGDGDDRPDARRQDGLAEHIGERRDAAPARQPRAGDRRRARSSRACSTLPEADAAGHQPRAATRRRRGRLPGAAARRRPMRWSCSASAHRPSRTMAFGELCRLRSTTSRSRSSWPPPAPASSTPAQIARAALAAPRPAQTGGRDADRPPTDPAGDDRMEPRPARRQRADTLRAAVRLQRRMHPRGRRSGR